MYIHKQKFLFFFHLPTCSPFTVYVHCVVVPVLRFFFFLWSSVASNTQHLLLLSWFVFLIMFKGVKHVTCGTCSQHWLRHCCAYRAALILLWQSFNRRLDAAVLRGFGPNSHGSVTEMLQSHNIFGPFSRTHAWKNPNRSSVLGRECLWRLNKCT